LTNFPPDSVAGGKDERGARMTVEGDGGGEGKGEKGGEGIFLLPPDS